MLDVRIYRAAFVPLLLAILVAAFSLESRPRAIGTTLAPDAFDADLASARLDDYATRYPSRRPGPGDDAALADRVALDLGVLGGDAVQTFRHRGQTIDGERELITVVATRPGRPGPGLVVVAHRDSAGVGARAELSGTAALVELARVSAAGRLRRTVTFVSTSGGSGGLAGAEEAVRRLPGPVDAVLVLGDLASRQVRKPWVVAWSSDPGAAPLRLRRTVEAAVREESGQDAGGTRARGQWARLAFGTTLSEQGAFGAAGLPAVLLSATGERPPAADAPVSTKRLGTFGRAALRTIFALDNGPTIAGGPERVLITQRKILPFWAVSALVAAALFPAWLAAFDGLARVRRRRLAVGTALRWVASAAIPFVLVVLVVLGLGLVGLLPARPGALVPAGALQLDRTAAAVAATLALVFAAGWTGARPALLHVARARAPLGDAHAAATAAVVALVSLVVWLVNPFAAALLVLPVHLWLLAVAPEVRLGRPAAAALALVALVPGLLALDSLGGQLGYSALEGAWAVVLLSAGGGVGTLSWLAWAVTGGTAVCVGLLVARRPPPPEDPPARGATVRGPRSYAGPGSLGGTDSALRR